MIFFTPAIVNCMEKYLDITKPRYSEDIFLVFWHFVISRFHCSNQKVKGSTPVGITRIFFFQLKKKSFSPHSVLSPVQNQQREFTLRQAKEMEKDAKQRLAIQRQEYEAAIQRHLSFIDQLIDDKKVLSQRCEEVVNKLKSTDKKYGDKIKQMEEK